MRQITAWLFDILPQEQAILTFWVTNEHKTLRCYMSQVICSIYAVPSANTPFSTFYKSLPSHSDIIKVCTAYKRVSIHDKHYSPVIEIQVPMSVNKQTFMHEIRDIFALEFYNIDLSNFQYFFAVTGLFPFCKAQITIDEKNYITNYTIIDELSAFSYELPPVRAIQLDIEFTSVIKRDKIKSVTFTQLSSKLTGKEEKTVIDGPDERQLILKTINWINEEDPDVLVTQGGDQDLRLFATQAVSHGLGELSFSREPSVDPLYKAAKVKLAGTSFMSYGGHYYKDHGYYLYGGRHHIDLRNSFTWKDGGFAGVVELARMSCIDAQRCARTSIGTNLTGMQIVKALSWDILIPSRKADVEHFRSGETLVVGDRGGFIYSPQVGLHFNVASIDFASMFPNIMVKHNISPETVNCECCAEGIGKPIPGTNWHTCEQRKGLVPLVLKTVLEKRLYYKKFRKSNKSYDQLQKTLKWILVTCFEPDTLLPIYEKNKLKFTRIGKFVDEIIADSLEIDQISVIGLNPARKIILNPIKNIIRLPSPLTMFFIQLENKYEIIVTGDHICFVLSNNALREVEAKNVLIGDMFPVLINKLVTDEKVDNFLSDNTGFSKVINIKEIPCTSKYVYCLEVENELPGFFAGTGGIFTHNCFGYQGYRNARFGRIEAHEAINAYARQSLLVAGEILQSYNFELVAGIVDSLWGKYSDEHTIDSLLVDQICQEIEEATDLPISNDGTYRWIVFLPRRHEPHVGVLNRYYGCFEDGSFKVRGIELRRRDTCDFIRTAQDEALQVLANATNKEQFYELLTNDFWTVHAKYDAQLLSREVNPEQLFIKKVIAKEPTAYVQSVHQAIAAQQLAKAGRSLQSGMKVSYLVTNATARTTLKRVIAKELYQGQFYDLQWYRKMLREAFTNIIPPVFYDKKRSSQSLSDFITENSFTEDIKYGKYYNE